MRRHRNNSRPNSRHNNEQGIVIMLVAVVMLFVVGAMAALSIDVVTLYTARSEAQIAADAGALAGARVLANSGATSDTSGNSLASVEATPGLASTLALQVAKQNRVAGSPLTAAQVSVTFGGSNTNPTVTVIVQKNDLPTFFARIWGTRTLTVKASATAEAYNPSNVPGTSASPKLPVAPACVKPWLLPNVSPNPDATSTQIFDPASGAILDTNLLGYRTANRANRLQPACDPDCSGGGALPNATSYHYYPGDPTTTAFLPPTQALPSCTPALTSPYQESIAGCIQTPIACNSQAYIDMFSNPTRNAETADAVTCLTHTQNNKGDQYDNAGGPGPPFQFIAGSDNPVPVIEGNNVMVSDSLVTVPVFDVASDPPANPVTIIGFLQLFLNPGGNATTDGAVGSMRTKVINVVGCGKNPMGAQTILGNGASPVAVRLISPP